MYRSVKLAAFAMFGLSVAAVLYVLLVSGHPAENPYLPKCPFHLLTGLHCFGCGGTRCLCALLSGNIAAAFRYHPLVPIAPLFFGVYWVILKFQCGNERIKQQCWYISIGLIIIVVVLFTVLRNIPLECFAWLRPPK